MTLIPKRNLILVNLVPLTLCALVALVWWLGFGRVPTVTPAQARMMLNDPGTNVALVDVRPASSFATHHLPDAVNWPWPLIRDANGPEGMPAELKERRLLVICETGLSSALAVRKLKTLGVRDVRNVQGGMVNWALAEPDATGTNATPAAAPPARPPAVRAMSVPKQWTVVITAFGVKPLYLLLSLAVIVVLWRRTEPDLTALCWGMIWFWGGEQACTANYLLYGGLSDLLEYLHNFGMAVGFAFVGWAAMEGMDLRLIRFTAPKDRCAALSLCRRCIKYTEDPCGLRRLFLFAIPATALLALLPLTADFKLAAYRSDVLGSSVCYSHTMASQLFEMRLCPVLALACFAASWLVLRFKRGNPVAPSKLLFAAGLGPLGFSLLRTFLVATFSDDLMWFETWEEWTELLFVLGTAFVLWVFWPGLAPRPEPASSAPTAP
jgi:rhodanese-related sulfurtransferase